jgi:hypothetical protein
MEPALHGPAADAENAAMSRRLVAVAVSPLCVLLAACGGSGGSGGAGLSASNVSSVCQHASDALRLGADLRLASTGVMTAAMIAARETHEGADANAVTWRNRPSSEKFAACTFAYKTPKESVPTGSPSPSPCPGGYMIEPAPVTDMGYILAVVDAKGHVTRLPIPKPNGDDNSC